ncbi:MAG: sulfite exporter TauE/SafE family protein [Rhodobacterales bacterium]|nr:sulfite exporter TauE/SafE family protein [Rhodobacterales bacterium]
MEQLASLLVAGTELDMAGFLALCGLSFIGSFITVAMGLGGGLLMLAGMALFLTPAVMIPLHGVVQLGSNAGRAYLMRRHVVLSVLPVFAAGSILGALVGANLFVALPVSVLQIILGLFVLYAVWAPRFKTARPGRAAFFGVGAVAAFTTMFVGATGPLIAPFGMAITNTRQEFVGTHATFMTLQHGIKVVAFGIIGFAFGAYLPLLAGLLLSGFAGTYVGRLALNRLPEGTFRMGLKLIITLLALRVLWNGVADLDPFRSW